MKVRQSVKNFGFRILRLVGGLLVIYVSMVFYLALTERQSAYPRAITHKEAQDAIQGKAKPLSCTLEDGITLEGWAIGNAEDPVLLYYPDANEDAAQFLAEVQGLPGLDLVSFNLRGSGNNKGTPSTDNFIPDARQIAECAGQLNGNKPKFLAGRGTGAILAAEQYGENQSLVLIDPFLSIADAISEKYRILYPKFLVRAKEKIPESSINHHPKGVFLLFDSLRSRDRNHNAEVKFPHIWKRNRYNSTLRESLEKIILQAQTQ